MATFEFRNTELPEPTDVDFQDADLSPADDGRDESGRMHKSVIGVFKTWSLKWSLLNNADHAKIMNVCRGKSKGLLKFPNPYGVGYGSDYYYCGDRSSSIKIIKDDNRSKTYWKDVSVTFIQNDPN